MKVFVEENAYQPTRAHSTDAGLDLRSPDTVYLPARESKVIDTGVHVELPKGTAGVLISKSGLNVRNGITSTGLIDEGYTGSIKVKLYNHSTIPYKVIRGDKISQLVIIPVLYEDVEIVDALLKDTERGERGFGSTGK